MKLFAQELFSFYFWCGTLLLLQKAQNDEMNSIELLKHRKLEGRNERRNFVANT